MLFFIGVIWINLMVQIYVSISDALELKFGEPSWKFSEPNRAELAAFEKQAEYELDFFENVKY